MVIYNIDNITKIDQTTKNRRVISLSRFRVVRLEKEEMEAGKNPFR